MSTTIAAIRPVTRTRLIEPAANFWSDAELDAIAILGCRDLWRDIVNLKQEHYCVIKNDGSVTLPPNSSVIAGLPPDIHKVYMIEPINGGENQANTGLEFSPLPYNDRLFQFARSHPAIDPINDTIYWALRGQGSPSDGTIIDVAPQVTSVVPISFTYIPTLGQMNADSPIPIPGEADNAIIAWTVAYARAKEREDRQPDPGWLAIYATEKGHLLESLGVRQYQEPSYAQAVFMDYWG